MGNNGCGGNADQDGVIEAVLVESVTYLEATLDFVGFDEGLKDCAHSQGWECGGTAEVVCDGQYGADVVCRGRSAQVPFSLFVVCLT